MLYFLLALKSIGFFLGFFYMALDRIALDGILTRSELAQARLDAKFASGEVIERRGRLRDPSRSWTVAGLVIGALLVVVAWVVYILYSVK